jgi:hypothetical protein
MVHTESVFTFSLRNGGWVTFWTSLFCTLLGVQVLSLLGSCLPNTWLTFFIFKIIAWFSSDTLFGGVDICQKLILIIIGYLYIKKFTRMSRDWGRLSIIIALDSFVNCLFMIRIIYMSYTTKNNVSIT